jgi:GT2 family glycosyltransferase
MTSISSINPQDQQKKARSIQEPAIWVCNPQTSAQKVFFQAFSSKLDWSLWTPSSSVTRPELGKALIEFSTAHPGQSLLVIAPELLPRPEDIRKLAEIAQLSDEFTVFSILSNSHDQLNPFAGLGAGILVKLDPEKTESCSEKAATLVSLLGTGALHPVQAWPDHLVYFSSSAIACLANEDVTTANALEFTREQGGQLQISDCLFALDAGKPLDNGHTLEPHEERRPAAWGELVLGLVNWLMSEASTPHISDEKTLVSLHLTHSWGGGVAQWVQSFIEADPSGQHFQLRSEGPQAGQGTAQRLSLYLGNELNSPVARWWLNPSILSSTETHPQYRKILNYICARYGIGRVMVSSLVGHSLDAFSTNLPTLQVLHDYFPAWPLLDVHPQNFLSSPREQRLERALQDHQLLPDFQDRKAGEWLALADAWRVALAKNNVQLVAPSQSVIHMLRMLDERWQSNDISMIHHGVPDLLLEGQILPRERIDTRLRVVIPGRVQESKGQSLLLEALDRLTPFAHITLLGAGKNGEAFFGKPGVNVILQYQREELPGLMQSLAPHVAALLSIVPETFSYTLSEMKQMGIPVIATKLGSLAERIDDGKDGWLIEPSADALVARVKELAADRSALSAVRNALRDTDSFSAAAMVEAYDAICPAVPCKPDLLAYPLQADIQTSALADQNARLLEENSMLMDRVEQRSEWAREREQAVQKEQALRDRWVNSLESALEEEQEQRKRWVSSLENTLQVERAAYEETRFQMDTILQSLSWRVTKPLRVLRRTAANIKRTQMWHPRRWPFMLSLGIRTIHSKGLKGALLRLQSSPASAASLSGREMGSLNVDIGDPNPPAALPRSLSPAASIIIPVFNKWEYTAACLRSIAEATNEADFEVIVVDDYSTDETPGRLESVEGLEVVSNRKNTGFIGSCNAGAALAKGQYIVMLNNDTQVMDGWLDSLLETFQKFPDTGLAGARLIYPNGSLQEAGGIIFRDGSGWNYGRGDKPGRPEYQFTREVDYCSGACIALPAELFRQLGGFDPYYSPAYYEDTDLAFKVRQAGFKVRVQAAATIIHHEGITSGTDIGSGTKRYQDINRKKFIERWQKELADYPSPIVDPENRSSIRLARDHHLRGRVLVIDAYTPEPDQDSGSLRLCYLFDCFQQLGYGVSFFADNRAYAGDYTKALQGDGVEMIYSPWIDSLPDFFRNRGSEFDYILVCRHYIAANYLALIKKFCPQAKFIFDTVDLHYLREERMAALENSLPLKRVAAQTKRSELAVIRQAAATLVVSPVEKSVLRKEAPDAHVHVLSNIHRVSGRGSDFASRKDLFFVGGYQHPPNIDAAQWFVGKIWPLIRKELPEIKFHLIGSKASEQVSSLAGNGVVFHGFVKKLEPWLDGCRLAIAPLRYGAGVKGKVNLSMAHGQPVVATPMAVEGLYARDGENILVAESEEHFARSVIRLYQDKELWNRVSEAGLDNVREHFSLECAQTSLKSLLDNLEQDASRR